MIVVCDTTPLNYLILVDSVHVLPALFGRLYVAPKDMLQLGSIPVAPIVFTNKPFGDHVEGLTYYGDRSYESTSMFNSRRAIKLWGKGITAIPLVMRKYVIQILSPVLAVANLYLAVELLNSTGLRWL